jgi:hypothetical protein
MTNAKKILWLSRHDMTADQSATFQGCEIVKVDAANLPNVHVPFEAKVNGGDVQTLPPFKEFIKEFDVLAVVLPIHLEQQVLGVADGRPVIRATNNRVTVPCPKGGEDKVIFNFAGWKQLVKIEVVLVDFTM